MRASSAAAAVDEPTGGEVGAPIEDEAPAVGEHAAIVEDHPEGAHGHSEAAPVPDAEDAPAAEEVPASEDQATVADVSVTGGEVGAPTEEEAPAVGEHAAIAEDHPEGAHGNSDAAPAPVAEDAHAAEEVPATEDQATVADVYSEGGPATGGGVGAPFVVEEPPAAVNEEDWEAAPAGSPEVATPPAEEAFRAEGLAQVPPWSAWTPESTPSTFGGAPASTLHHFSHADLLSLGSQGGHALAFLAALHAKGTPGLVTGTVSGQDLDHITNLINGFQNQLQTKLGKVQREYDCESSHGDGPHIPGTQECARCLLATFQAFKFSSITNISDEDNHRYHNHCPKVNGRLQSNKTGTRDGKGDKAGKAFPPCGQEIEPLKAAVLAAARRCVGLHVLPEQSALLYSLRGVVAQYQHADFKCNTAEDLQALLTGYVFIWNLDTEPYPFNYVCMATGKDNVRILQKGEWLLAHPLLIHYGPGATSPGTDSPFLQLR